MAASIPPPDAEAFVPFAVPRDRLVLATQVRSTLLASSIRSLRSRGLFDRYAAHIEPRWRDAILGAVAGVWLPIDAGVAHYAACDALGLSPPEQVTIGREVGERVHGTFLSTMIRAARTAGVTPWTALAYTGKLYERLFVGGGCAVVRVGPKDARVDMVKNPIVATPYFRNGMRGLYCVGLELFCQKAYANEIPSGTNPTSYALKLSWA